MLMSGVIFTLFASTNKPKSKVAFDFDDLAPGLNIDLMYYLDDDHNGYKTKKAKKEQELVTLLNK